MQATFAMSSGFLFAWAPYAVCSVIGMFCKFSDSTIQFTAFLPLFAKSCVLYNPVIYFIYIKSYRQAIKDYFGHSCFGQQEVALEQTGKTWAYKGVKLHSNYNWSVIHPFSDFTLFSMRVDRSRAQSYKTS